MTFGEMDMDEPGMDFGPDEEPPETGVCEACDRDGEGETRDDEFRCWPCWARYDRVCAEVRAESRAERRHTGQADNMSAAYGD